MPEWLKGDVLKAFIEKMRGFESYSIRTIEVRRVKKECSTRSDRIRFERLALDTAKSSVGII